MPFGKISQAPVPKPHMVKTHAGMGNHKLVMKTHGAVRANGNLHGAPTNQPNSGLGTKGSSKSQ